ncbi:LLM class F420-dependent oxidoreductase [Nocardia pseudobrasiliensis]|uniref:F420-dependent oxidoreductase-like protein n=1 Tax=Nocardia pseudobrasiliensis TaxID=45979 RepID=A0A370IG90_9NOCA|nr:LLM class F420-dependent oxidoreductase [Nocardia pseudobrasiliensis]RDI69171.1 F420-dependent oxidoreductase-like protein [Nocardia pseudobrasiliensis]
MKLGLTLSDFSYDVSPEQLGPLVAGLAEQADEAGFDSLWVMDHFFQIHLTGRPPQSPLPEAYATLGFLAGRTRRIRLGTLVTSIAYRHPGVLLKQVTALDVFSGGRMYFGVGAGARFDPEPMGPGTRWEAEGLGIPFPSLAERFERLEEVLRIAEQMWSEDEAPYYGTHYTLMRTLNSPNSIQRPHPPILVAGSGERKTLRLVARYADACNLSDMPDVGLGGDIGHKLEVLRKHCAEIGRDYATIEKTVGTRFDPTAPDRLLVRLRELAELGVDHAVLAPTQPWTTERLATLGALLPEIHALGA